MNGDDEKIYASWLELCTNVDRRKKHRLLQAAGTPSGIYRLIKEQRTKEIDAIAGAQTGDKLYGLYEKITPWEAWDNMSGLGIGYTYYGAQDYPDKLIDIPDPPFGIFYKGTLPDKRAKTAAVIGTRTCSDYGMYMAEKIAGDLAASGVAVISGMALGIDAAAQKAALKAGGRSYGVLGSGVDVIYPPANKALYYDLIKGGGVISELPPKAEPKRWNFPPRNRIISALSDVVVVVEANEKSGTFITVDMALEQGREVYAVPGRCTDRMSLGCNKLLRLGAGLATSAEDIICDMGWEDILSPRDVSDAKIKERLTDIARDIYDVLDVMPLTQDEIVFFLEKKGIGYPAAQISKALLELELRRAALKTSGGYRLI